MRPPITPALGFLIAILVSTPAVADGTEQEVHVYSGIGSAVGLLGGTYDRRIADHVTAEAGLGYGASGLQLSLMPKLIWGDRSNRFIMGMGLALAIASDADDRAKGPTLWLNADLAGYEHVFDSGLSIVAAFGMTMQVAGGYCPPYEASGRQDELCKGDDFYEDSFRPFPQARLGLGYRFY